MPDPAPVPPSPVPPEPPLSADREEYIASAWVDVETMRGHVNHELAMLAIAALSVREDLMTTRAAAARDRTLIAQCVSLLSCADGVPASMRSEIGRRLAALRGGVPNPTPADLSWKCSCGVVHQPDEEDCRVCGDEGPLVADAEAPTRDLRLLVHPEGVHPGDLPGWTALVEALRVDLIGPERATASDVDAAYSAEDLALVVAQQGWRLVHPAAAAPGDPQGDAG